VEILVPPSAIAKATFDRQDWSLIVEATVNGAAFMSTFYVPILKGPRDPDDYDGEDDEDDQDDADETTAR
jgi:hypothetical protein